MDLNNVYIGIEFGSTRIKGIAIDKLGKVLASGAHQWENELRDGFWTYSLDSIKSGLQSCFKALKDDFKAKQGIALTKAGAMGISAMMHGYLVFDKDDNLLVPFRTWRNVSAEKAGEELTKLFDYHIPARWSIAHLYQAILDNEPHVKGIAFMTTLEGYAHYLLTGKKVIGIGEASGMFPIAEDGSGFDRRRISIFDAILKERGYPFRLSDILPKTLVAGQEAGRLSLQGALLLDPSGEFSSGTRLCPPEGDAETGMIATNSIKPLTGNVSSGTSIFASIVLDKPLKKAYPEIDLVATPLGKMVAMVHVNNCTSDINAYMGLFSEVLSGFGADVPQETLFVSLFKKSLEAEDDASGIISYNYLSGEPLTGVKTGHPLLYRSASSSFTLPNFMRSLIYGSFASLALGFDILAKEGVKVKELSGHGGLFKTSGVASRYMSSALNVPLRIASNAGEGGAWGSAVLASYLDADMGLEEYLDSVIFKGQTSIVELPEEKMKEGFARYIAAYKKGLKAEKSLEEGN